MKHLNPFWKSSVLVCVLLLMPTAVLAKPEKKTEKQLDSELKKLGTVQTRQKEALQKLAGSCENNPIQFDDIKGKSVTVRTKTNNTCGGNTAQLIEAEKQLKETTKLILINRLEANYARYEVRAEKTSTKVAYQELSANIHSILANDVLKTLDPKTKADITRVANNFLDKAKNASTAAGLSICTDCGDTGPIQDLAKAINELKKK